jgi:endonuclease/exonuclease/phosphatase family metal-dependent hydrolase
VALQEVVPTTVAQWRAYLAHSGLVYCVDSFALQDQPSTERRRRYGELLASRWPLTPLPPTAFRVPWPERILSAVLASPWGVIELHTTGIPPGVSNGWLKVEMLEGIYGRLACPSACPRLLCGDLNTPQAESTDGRLTTWGQVIAANGRVRTWKTKRDRFGRVDTGDRWDAAERSVLAGLAAFGLPDVFRTLHGYDVEEWSWYWKGRHQRIGRRFDHVFASPQLHAVQCYYLHAWRETGLSDHAPLEVHFAPGHAAPLTAAPS